MMRSTIALVLFSAALSGGLLAVGSSAQAAPTAAPVDVTAAPVHVVPASIPGCQDWNYACGYRYGFADGRAAYENGLCARHHRRDRQYLVASERGYENGFEHYCPA
jgi:hypothetical protein